MGLIDGKKLIEGAGETVGHFIVTGAGVELSTASNIRTIPNNELPPLLGPPAISDNPCH